MPPDRRVTAVCAMGVEAWGVRQKARDVSVLQVGIGGRPPRDLGGIVISAGLCGGLLPEQTPGMVVIATQVVDENGATYLCDPAIVAALDRAAEYLRLPVSSGSLLSASGMVTGPARAAWAGRGHVAVDMESAGAAERAQRFGVLRVILDAPSRELSPEWAQPGRALRRPSNWRDALWLAINTPRYALRVGAVLEAAFLGNIDPEV